MRFKQLAVALLCSGAFIAPALAQTTAAPKPMAPAATPAASAATAPAPMPAGSAPMTTPMPSGAAQTSGSAPAPTAAAPMTGMTNINTASAADLDKLPMIGKRRAASIIKGRPYKTTDDLLTKKVLTKGVFDKIKDKITA